MRLRHAILASTVCLGCAPPDRPVDHDAELAASRLLPYRAAIDLRLAERRPRIGHPGRIALGRGFSAPEPWGTWSVGREASLEVVLEESGPFELRLVALPHVEPGRRDAQRIAVHLDGNFLGEHMLETDMQEYRFPPLSVTRGVHRVNLAFAHTSAPQRSGSDPRELAVGFARIGFYAPGVEDSQPVDPPSAPGPFLSERGTWIVPLPGPAPSERIEIGIAAAAARSWPASLGWKLGNLLESRETTGRAQKRDAGDARRATYELRLEGRDGPTCLNLPIDEHLAGPDSHVASLSGVASGAHPARAPEPAQPRRLPDVVVVLLDAARPDHIGAYGYARDTTPNLDRLAQQALVFRDVSATASYTLGSVPTMLTGLSFAHHGVERNGQALADERTTLAEALRDLGYRTACYSANPNHAPEAGLAQGCDEFQSIWGPGDRSRWIDPALVTDEAIAFLERHEPGRPLFLFLHYVPPHEPYRPGPEFDLFGDPAYRGSATGELDVRRAIDRGEREATTEDLAEIVALYDGNLRKADASVGRLIAALAARDRWSDTVIAVTADHGEAFMEHGRMGHNSTVYEEMLRVPLILRLPEDRRPADVDLQAPATLEDLTPTLLALAGGTPRDPRTTGLNLLDPAVKRPGRLIVSRSAGDRPDYGIRAGQWKAIAAGGLRTDWRLYDLEADPGETRDLSLAHLDTLACLAALGDLALLPAGPEPAPGELPRRDAEALRALGYVD